MPQMINGIKVYNPEEFHKCKILNKIADDTWNIDYYLGGDYFNKPYLEHIIEDDYGEEQTIRYMLPEYFTYLFSEVAFSRELKEQRRIKNAYERFLSELGVNE